MCSTKLNFCILIFIIISVCFISFSSAVENRYAGPGHIIWVSGRLPRGAQQTGKWSWDEAFQHEGTKTHVQDSGGRINRRSFKTNNSVHIDKDSKIIQYIYIDPRNASQGIMIKLFFTLSSKEEVCFYWEGNEEVFAKLDEYINAWYMGFIPESGRWLELVIDFNSLDIPLAELSGIEFIISDGKVWWGNTVIENIS